MSGKIDTGIVRCLDDIGRLVIPIEIRKELGISRGDPVHMYVENNKVILEKYRDACHVCGKFTTNYLIAHNKKICPECCNEIREQTKSQ